MNPSCKTDQSPCRGLIAGSFWSWERFFVVTLFTAGSLNLLWIAIPVWRMQNLNDDSYITLAYAKNIVLGNGFVFNHPPAALGTTAPLFAFLTAFLAGLFSPFSVVEFAIVVSITAWIGSAVVLYLLLRHAAIAAIPASLIAGTLLFTVRVWVFFIGMEMMLFEFLLVFSILLYVRKHHFWTGLTIAALTLTRGEGALVGALLMVHLVLNDRRNIGRFVLGGALPMLAWVVYSLSIFGSIIPNTLQAKQFNGSLPAHFFVKRMLMELLPGYFGLFSFRGHWWLNPYFLLAGSGLFFIIRHCKILFFFIAWAMTYFISYSLLDPGPFYWYMLHIVFVFQILAGAGVAFFYQLYIHRLQGVARIAVGITGIILAVGFYGPGLNFSLLQAQRFTGYERATAYRSLAEWFVENASPEQSIAAIEIGYLGYFTPNRIIDLAGLTDPLIARNLENFGFSWGFYHYRPDYFINNRTFDGFLGDIDPIASGYILVHEVVDDAFPEPLYIYARQNASIRR